jgi:hypothetical protein
MAKEKKDDRCWAQVGEDYCQEDAIAGDIYCEKHSEEFNS